MRKGIRGRLALGMLALLGAAGIAEAADTLRLVNEVFQEIEVKDADGKVQRQMVPAAKVPPGTEVIYVITYRNQGVEAADNIVITNPVAKELAYEGDSAGAQAEVSVDGGAVYGSLAALRVVDRDGQERPAGADDVTHVRWKLGRPVLPGEEGRVSFRAVLR